ncbi:MAG: PLP-dependent aminotransferase family protein, partial [Candidatus Binatia bacterium]
SSLFALRARLLRAPAGVAAGGSRGFRYDFRGGQVDGELVPAEEFRRSLAAALRRRTGELAGYAHPLGWPPLRDEVTRLLVGRGIECDANEVAVVSGAQQAIDLVARVLVDPGDTVVIEQPGYFGASMAFGACQANLVGIGIDEEGIRTDELARVLQARRVKLVFTTPGTQSPTGVVMSEIRRRELLRLADEHQTPILEDDYAAELRYHGPPVPALKAKDHAGQVIYAGTFSKIVFPSLRIGYVVASPPVLEKLALARWTADAGAALLPQMALATLLRSGELERHLRRVRKLYAERLQAMLAALARSMPPPVRWTEPVAGQGVWLTLPPPTDGEAVFREAMEQEVAYTRGDVFHLDGQGMNQCHLSFAKLPPSRIAEGIERLARIVGRHLVRTRSIVVRRDSARRSRRERVTSHEPRGGRRVAHH